MQGLAIGSFSPSYGNIMLSHCTMQLHVATIDNSSNVLFISRQVHERVIKSSLCVEPCPIVGNVCRWLLATACVKRLLVTTAA